MKKLFAIICFVLLSGIIQAQSKKEKAIQAAVNQLVSAMISGDRHALEQLTSEHLSYGHSSGNVESKNEFVEKIASGKSDFVSIDITEQKIDVIRSMAIVRHLFTGVTNDNGKLGDVKLKILLIFQKEGTSWKLVARQAVKA
jgi:hypothetical protein